MKKTILVLSILLLTACKNNEYKGSTGTDQGLKTKNKPKKPKNGNVV